MRCWRAPSGRRNRKSTEVGRRCRFRPAQDACPSRGCLPDMGGPARRAQGLSPCKPARPRPNVAATGDGETRPKSCARTMPVSAHAALTSPHFLRARSRQEQRQDRRGPIHRPDAARQNRAPTKLSSTPLARLARLDHRPPRRMELLLQTSRTQDHACRMGSVRHHGRGLPHRHRTHKCVNAVAPSTRTCSIILSD